MTRKIAVRRFTRFICFTRFSAAALTLAVVLSSAGLSAAGRRPLSGDVSGGIDAGEYLVTAALSVPAGDTLRIGPGAVMYFEQLTGIDVRGMLSVSGAPGHPVVMTSSSDTAGASEAAQAFDWNGIRTFGPGAAVFMRDAVVRNSVYGVNVGDALSRTELTDVVFMNNGYAPLVRAGEIAPAAADEPVSVAWNTEAQPPAVGNKRADAVKTAKPGRKAEVKFIVNATALTVAAAGLTACYIGLSNTGVYYEHYVPEGNTGRFSGYYEEKIRESITVSAIGAIAAGIGLSCMGITLFF